MVIHTYNPALEKQKQEDQKFKVSLVYPVSFRLAGTI